jgi:hypothetical protein
MIGTDMKQRVVGPLATTAADILSLFYGGS